MSLFLSLMSPTEQDGALPRSGIALGASSSTSLLLRGTTGLMWLALLAVSGPLAWKAMLAMGIGVGWQRHRHGRPSTTIGSNDNLRSEIIPRVELPLPVSRQELASSFGVEEKTLFRVRHARICQVSHSADGTILAIHTIPEVPAISRPPQHAHPVS